MNCFRIIYISLNYIQVNISEHDSNVNSVYREELIYRMLLCLVLVFLGLKMRTAGKHCDQSVKVMSETHKECQTAACITHQ